MRPRVGTRCSITGCAWCCRTAKRQEAVELARSQILLDPDPDAVTTAALEDWGHDTEAAWAWRGLSLGGASRGPSPLGSVRRIHARGPSRGGARRVLVRDDRGIELAPGLPDEWWGQDFEVFDVPTRSGKLSYALRWHGDRAAVLWEVTDPSPDLVLRAPTLDPTWSTTAPAGDALLTPANAPAPDPH